ncbi:uncharacterized protein PFL1_03864 [Pseudozyma flocculosa PF-1]|uniref:Uncharacterized protein n=2 Tax=Pseudozyma flocculosa TaxID=84751 RepID=A0A5C3EW40_9BASI|nr:uncharacterized protein PFL1_03864 [Pseudozyma flocculosa PF-1]EPQ28560.1 hypothetical protein PFL1_03864 [Pseudozyma flocculosa PF-1]SPO36494.1 uncharacterized protein PSFLO_01965 [Pseudozyma flocculosa]
MMEIAEDPPLGPQPDVDYEMRMSGPSHLPFHASTPQQQSSSSQQDDVMADEAAVAEDIQDGMMADEYEEQSGQGIAPSNDADVEFVEEAVPAMAAITEPTADAAPSQDPMTLEMQAGQAETNGESAPLQTSASGGDVPVSLGETTALVPDATIVDEGPSADERSAESSGPNAATGQPEPTSTAPDASAEATGGSSALDPAVVPTELHEVDELASTSFDQSFADEGAAEPDEDASARDQAQPSRADAPAENGLAAEHEAGEEDQLEHSIESDDGTLPPTVRVSFNGQDFVLFSHDEPPCYTGASQAAEDTERDATAEPTVQVPAPKLKVADDTFWQPLESLFASLRVKDCLGEFLEEATELVLHMPDLDLTVQEDNVYGREITLDDLFQLHQGLGYGTSLHLLITEAQRFISKYNVLAQHVANLIEQAHDEHGEAEQSGQVDVQAHRPTTADANDENDELDAGDADAHTAAQAVEEIVSAENAEVEDDSHEAYEEAGDVTAEAAEATSAGEHADAAPPAETAGPDPDLAEDAAAAPASDAGPSGTAAQAPDGEAEAAEHEEADQTYVTVNEEGDEDELDEIDEADGVEGAAGANGDEAAAAADQTEEWDEQEAYEDEPEGWQEDGGDDGLAEEEEGEYPATHEVADGAEAEDGAEAYEDEAEEEADFEEGEAEAEEEAEEGEAVGDEAEEADEGEEEDDDEEGDGSVTIDDSDGAVDQSYAEAATHVGPGDDEEEIVEYEDHTEEPAAEGPAALGPAEAEADDSVYGDASVASAGATAALNKRGLEDDSAGADDADSGDTKRARVD